MASLFLGLLLSALLSTTAHAQALHFHRTPVEGQWRLAFELAFGEASPYSSRFPSLYDERLPYEIRRAITKYVLDRIIRIALRETGAQRVALVYGPGGYNDFPVVPSAQLTLRASDRNVHRVLNIIGYLAQQTVVIGSKRRAAGGRPALEIIETSGHRLAGRAALEKFWRRLAELSPKLGPGFSSMERGGRPGLYIIDSDGDWKPEDARVFDETVRTVSREFGIVTVVEHFAVEYLEIGNDWKTRRDGAAYLDRLDEGRRSRLIRRYQPQVARLIVRAFKKYAPGILKQREINRMDRIVRIKTKSMHFFYPDDPVHPV